MGHSVATHMYGPSSGVRVLHLRVILGREHSQRRD